MTEQTDAAEVRDVDGNHELGAGALAERLWPLLAAREAAAEARGAQAERERRMDYAAVKGYELGYVEGARDALLEAAKELPGFDTIRTHGDAAAWLRARAAAALVAPSRVPGEET